MFIDKQFYGDLNTVSVVADSGTLHGGKGTFLLQHSGVMARGTPHISEDFVFWQAVIASGTPFCGGKWRDRAGLTKEILPSANEKRGTISRAPRQFLFFPTSSIVFPNQKRCRQHGRPQSTLVPHC